MPQKMERFTQRARMILGLAQGAASEFNHAEIDTGHLLLAMVREEGGVAGRVLRELEVTPERVEDLLTRKNIPEASPEAQLDLSAGTKRTLELGVDEARRMGHHYIGTEHLLLGLVRPAEGMALDILRELGVSSEEVRRQTRRVLMEVPSNAEKVGDDKERLIEFVLQDEAAAELGMRFRVTTRQLNVLIELARASAEQNNPLVVEVREFAVDAPAQTAAESDAPGDADVPDSDESDEAEGE